MSETKERNYRSVKNTALISLVFVDGDKNKPKPVTENSYLEGYFLQTTPNQGPKNNSNVHLFEVHNLEGKKLDKPEEFGMWGAFVMDDQLAKVTPGTWVKIKYNGIAKPKKSGNPYHDFEVWTDPSDMKQLTVRKEVVAVSNNSASATAERAPEAAEAGADDDLPF